MNSVDKFSLQVNQYSVHVNILSTSRSNMVYDCIELHLSLQNEQNKIAEYHIFLTGHVCSSLVKGFDLFQLLTVGGSVIFKPPS